MCQTSVFLPNAENLMKIVYFCRSERYTDMKTLSRVLLLSAICFVMAFSTTSCEKEPQGPSQQDIESNIIGKWKLVGRDGKEVVTNMSMVCTYYPGGKSTISTTTGYKLYNEKNIWKATGVNPQSGR